MVTGVVLLVVPPKLEPAERLAAAISNTQHAIGIQKLFDVGFVGHGDPFHLRILHDMALSMAFIQLRPPRAAE